MNNDKSSLQAKVQASKGITARKFTNEELIGQDIFDPSYRTKTYLDDFKSITPVNNNKPSVG